MCSNAADFAVEANADLSVPKECQQQSDCLLTAENFRNFEREPSAPDCVISRRRVYQGSCHLLFPLEASLNDGGEGKNLITGTVASPKAHLLIRWEGLQSGG